MAGFDFRNLGTAAVENSDVVIANIAGGGDITGNAANDNVVKIVTYYTVVNL